MDDSDSGGARNGDVQLASVSAASFEARAKEYQAAFRSFLAARCDSDVRKLLQSLTTGGTGGGRLATTAADAASDAQQQSFAFSLRMCAQALLDFNPGVGTLLFRHPDQFLPLFHAALAQEVTAASASAGGVGFAALPLRVRQKLKVRVEFLPPAAPLRKAAISTIRSHDVKQLIQIAGTVVRTGMIKMQETSREYQCSSSRCGYRFLVKSDPEQGNVLEIPKVCPSERSGKPCKSTQFDVVDNSRVVADHQVIKIQEQVSKLGVGSIPRAILVVLEDDLVDSVKAGDHVVVVGILMRCWRPVLKDVRCDLETLVRANSIRITNATAARVLVTEELKKEFALFWAQHARDPMRGRNEIIASVCPKVYGLFVVKLGVALTVIGGCAHVSDTGMKTRGEPHMLLIGDPGTGKSQFLRFTAELSPRSVLTTGIGTTSAGLTCTAVKDGGEWVLEAGALVLADRGVCCIDEFSSIRSHDRTSIHEAMEQQTLSVAKAGLVCKLNARTTVFAVTNPKGRYDPSADVAVNTAIGSPLLSRFDLILVLLDRTNRRWDEVVSSFILQQSMGQQQQQQPSSEVEDEAKDKAKDRREAEEEAEAREVEEKRAKAAQDELLWPVAKLQAYICLVKDKFQPPLSRSAMLILQRYYQLQRSSDTRSAARTTIRLLESLTRLSQAHARLMWHAEVGVVDAVVAVFVMEVSKATDSCASLLGGGLESVLHSDFAVDPAAEYALQEKLVLESLGLPELATSTRSGSSQSAGSQQRSSSSNNNISRDDARSRLARGDASAMKRWPPSQPDESDAGDGGYYASAPKRHRLGDPPAGGAAWSSASAPAPARAPLSSQQRSWTQRFRDGGGGGGSGRRSSEFGPTRWQHADTSGDAPETDHRGGDDGDGGSERGDGSSSSSRVVASGASRFQNSRFSWSQQQQQTSSVTSKWRK